MLIDLLNLNAFNAEAMKVFTHIETGLYVVSAIFVTLVLSKKVSNPVTFCYGFFGIVLSFLVLMGAMVVEEESLLMGDKVALNKEYITKERIANFDRNITNLMTSCANPFVYDMRADEQCSAGNSKIIFEKIDTELLSQMTKYVTENRKVRSMYFVGLMNDFTEKAAKGILSGSYSGVVNEAIETKVVSLMKADLEVLDLHKKAGVDKFDKYVEFYKTGCGVMTKPGCEAVKATLLANKESSINYDPKKELEISVSKLESKKN